MRILFINFNLGSTPGINNGLAVLSSLLKEKGHDVRAIFLCEDMGYGFDLKRIEKDVMSFKPDIIGLSIMEPQFKYAAAFAKDARRYFKGFLLCGGPHPTMAPEEVLATEGVDAVCVGEGEGAMLELVKALESGKDCTFIKNLWCKSRDGKIIKNRLRPFANLGDLPPDDKGLFDLSEIIRLKNFQLEVLLGRGCVYECAYCINKAYVDRYKTLCVDRVKIKDYVRIKKPDTVICEIKDALSRHPAIKKIAFIDDNFLMYSSFIKEFFIRYKEEIGLPFMCNANPLSFNEANGRLLKEAGCDDIRFGVESGSERVKKIIMNRPVSNKSIVEAFKLTMSLGLMTSSFNMIGLPTESREEVMETLELNARLMPDTVKVMTFYPFKNTPLYDLCEKLGLIDHDRKRKLDNYDVTTCLKFDGQYRLFLAKVQAVFNWYINIFLKNEASAEYASLVKEVEALSDEEWSAYDFLSRDKGLSESFTKKGIAHYSKFVNRSLAVKFPSRHFDLLPA